MAALKQNITPYKSDRRTLKFASFRILFEANTTPGDQKYFALPFESVRAINLKGFAIGGLKAYTTSLCTFQVENDIKCFGYRTIATDLSKKGYLAKRWTFSIITGSLHVISMFFF